MGSERVYTDYVTDSQAFLFAHKAVWICGTLGFRDKNRANRKSTPFCVIDASCRSWRSDTTLTTATCKEVHRG